MSFHRSGAISINSSLFSAESDLLVFLAVSISFLHASPLNILRTDHINDRSGSCPSSMSGKYFASFGTSFTSPQTSFTLSSLYLGTGSWVFSLYLTAYYDYQLCLCFECLPVLFLRTVPSRKMLGISQMVADIIPLTKINLNRLTINW